MDSGQWTVVRGTVGSGPWTWFERESGMGEHIGEAYFAKNKG